MSESQIDNCCKELCAEFKIKDESRCKKILTSFFASKPESQPQSIVSGCSSIIKSGERKNKPCGQAVVPGTDMCKRHTPKTDQPTPTPKTKPVKEKEEEEKKKEKKPTTTKVKKGEIQQNTPVFKAIEEKRETFKVQKNKFNNFVHKETGFVFNQQTHKVFGVQNEDGTIAALSVKDIELCKDNHWDFEIPDKVITEKPTVNVRRPTVTVEDDDDDDEEEEDEQ